MGQFALTFSLKQKCDCQEEPLCGKVSFELME
jgi:hypothetical protein